jgi:hypothetical protein
MTKWPNAWASKSLVDPCRSSYFGFQISVTFWPLVKPAGRYTIDAPMLPETMLREQLAARGDRRRVPRYSCSGLAQITSLPTYGSLLRGRVRDLGLGGCCIECAETVPLLDLGDRTEILLEVNSWFFRAMAQVRAIRGRSGMSMEFVRMSAGGSSMLADLVADLERPRARQERLVQHSRRVLQGDSQLHSGLSSGLSPAQHRGTAIVGTIVPAHSDEETSSAANRYFWLRGLHRATPSIDIFV